ncbi:hypothetical protein R6Q59_003162 [Mikania micrantha]
MIQNLTCVIQNHRREPPLSLWSHEQNTHIDERCVYCLTARTKERTRVAGRKWLLASKLPEEPGGGGDKEKLTTMKPSFFASSLVSTGLPKEPTIPRRSSGMHGGWTWRGKEPMLPFSSVLSHDQAVHTYRCVFCGCKMMREGWCGVRCGGVEKR